MKECINAAHAEIMTILEKQPNKMLTRQELADFLEKLKCAILFSEDDNNKVVINEDMSALCLIIFGDDMKQGVSFSDILSKYYDK